MCDSCDAGMYLMPTEYLYQDPLLGTTYKKRNRVCVPDCNAANSAMVNNPETLRREFLGQYCQFGNYTHGCLRSHRNGELTQILSHLETAHDFPFKLWQVDNPSTYSVSVLTTTYALAQTDAQNCLLRNVISDPLFPTFSHCILCTPQYFSQNYTTHFENRVVYNQIGQPVGREVNGQRGNSCVRQCRPGKYQRVTMLQEEQEVSEVQSEYGIGRGICANCSDKREMLAASHAQLEATKDAQLADTAMAQKQLTLRQ
ncbi:hypothetical protein FGO68_gene10019 [Halteria grandinella]|uniref:Uncharacterized protein n=1 Tax=Halteria grandinella TaxID=5974 RepID=A0A8J8N9S0_HALGN|nr:hypothetical protein FGO68_gene10019 [Halteria grandinella]